MQCQADISPQQVSLAGAAALIAVFLFKSMGSLRRLTIDNLPYSLPQACTIRAGDFFRQPAGTADDVLCSGLGKGANKLFNFFIPGVAV